MPRAKDYDERNISQQPAIEVLKALGYRYLTPEEAEAMRGNQFNVILKDVLEEKLRELNSYEYKGDYLSFQ